MNNSLILITGGSSGIGKAAASELHKQGAKIILQARDIEKLKSAAREIDPSGNRISFYSTDLSDQESVESSAKKIIENDCYQTIYSVHTCLYKSNPPRNVQVVYENYWLKQVK